MLKKDWGCLTFTKTRRSSTYMYDNEIKIGFLEEGEQVIEEMETLLLDLEHTADKKETFDGIFRAVHNVKGSAKAVGFDQLGAYCHDLETYLLVYKNGEKPLTKDVINYLLNSRDVIAAAFATYKKDLNAVFDFNVGSDNDECSDEENSHIEMNTTGLVVAKKATNSNDTSVRVNLQRVDKLINAVGELVVLDSVLRQQCLSSMDQAILKTVEQAGKIIREVQDLSMSLRMVPVKPLVQKLQRISRDTSSSVEKSVDFRVVGEDIEIDKTILDSISDPLVHIIRNAIDHGIEAPEERVVQGKPAAGFLELSFSQEGGKLVLRIKDDGKGLDQQRIIAKAIEKDIITSGDNMNESQIFELIFAPGFSTKAAVTEVSGRGVGMDVVRTSVESLGGQIEITSELHKGTEFTIALPLTVAIIEGMVVKTTQDNFIIPFTQVTETVKITDENLTKGSESGTLLNLRGRYLPVYSLRELLGDKKTDKKNGIGIIAKSARVNFVVLVDDVVGQQQIVVKQLGAELSGFKRFIGSGVLGDGKPALILDLAQLADEELKRVKDVG